MVKIHFLKTLIGLVLFAMGVIVLCGWILHVPLMVQFKAGFVPMVFNSALCFTLVGSALALPGLTRKSLARFQRGIGATLIALCGLTFLEILLDTGFGIDWPSLHTWIGDGNIRPGRMAPNTALGFMTIGATLILMHRVSATWQARAVQILTFSVLAIGLTGLVGYVLAPDLLYGWARSARMAIQTASGMILASVALWLSWNNADWYRSRKHFREDEKISFMGGAILAVVAITAGLTGFVAQQTIFEASLRQSLQSTFNSRVALFHASVDNTMEDADSAAKRPGMVDVTRRLMANSADRGAAAQFAGIAKSLISAEVRGVALQDMAGHEVARAGDFTHDPGFVAALPLATPSVLLWDGALYLKTESPISNGTVQVGKLVMERSLASLYAQLFHTSEFGTTGEVGLCIDRGETLLCLPQNRNPKIYSTKRFSGFGKPLPMTLATGGQSGVAETVDYRGHNVIAAYSPLSSKLGLVIKEDTVEVYAAIREQFKIVMLWLALLVVLGVALLRSQLKPLALKLMASEATAAEKEEQISTLLRSVGEGILTIDEKGIIVSFNPAASGIFGYPADAVIGKNIKMLMPPAMRGPHDAGMQRYLQGGEAHVVGRQNVELPGMRQDGSTFTLELSVNEMHANNQRLFVGIVRDITQRKEVEQKLTQLAQYDSLTGLPNRALFMDRLSGALSRVHRNGKPIGLMFLDLDGFKQINDTLGHHSGDELLKQFAARLSVAVRKTDTVSRLAGDEFTIILEGLTQQQDAEAVANKIIDAMKLPFLLGNSEQTITTSIGLAVHAAGDVSVDDLLMRADNAMYQAKNNGKNQLAIAGPLTDATSTLQQK